MKLKQVIKRLSLTKDEALQKEVLRTAWETCDYFFTGLQMSNDSQSKVILEKIPEIEEDDGFEGNFTFEEFASLFDKVTQVNANKEEARLLVLDAANEADVYEWNNFYRKILLKKLHLDLPMPVIIETLKELTGYQNPL